MAACVTWIPSHVWDRQQHQTNVVLSRMLPRKLRVWWTTRDDFGKKDDDDDDDDTRIKSGSKVPRKRRTVSKAVTYFFLGYMVYNWCGERGWIAKHDGGDIGEFLRFSQYWVMYGTVSTRTVNTLLTGRLDSSESETSRHVDILTALRTGSWGEGSELNSEGYSKLRAEIAEDMSAQFPSPRWERALSQWGEQKSIRQARKLCTVLCKIGNEQRARLGLGRMSRVELVWQHLHIMPIGSTNRFQKDVDTVIEVVCKSSEG
jgi:hypothetical protein